MISNEGLPRPSYRSPASPPLSKPGADGIDTSASAAGSDIETGRLKGR